ncbi:FAD-binding domain-containing protein [Thioalkalivibrio sp.]|uniref:FAD-binding domain-containing protein n=1 Tax=Thioalkalivibrio sp. TaxID=2093813 RepID=UPI0025E78206|nr:FAD-binding domain-containing protein [Thioalkalivibrio sp.]
MNARDDEHLILFPPKRGEALARLEAFVPNAGRRYADARNRDPGPGLRDNVSMLSPYIRHRVLTEQEVLAAVLRQHSPQVAEKFIQEVFWRTYWKGWLQMRPQVWQAFLRERDADRELLERSPGRRAALACAEEGRTGIDGFDDWARELVQTGYLHNHARMWFASIWIFTLRLPWSLGADFFLRHLLDADPASNTLGWRWVAGIQTPGKTYLAQPDNIEKFTGGRYRPKGLASQAQPIRREAPPHPSPLRPAAALPSRRPAILLLHGDDFAAHELVPPGTDVRAIVVAANGHPDHPWPFGRRASRFVASLAADTANRLTRDGKTKVHIIDVLQADALRRHCGHNQVRTIVTTEAPVGPLADGLQRLTRELAGEGIDVVTLRRRWDDLAWPHATHGFFRFRRQIPELISYNGLGTPEPLSE